MVSMGEVQTLNRPLEMTGGKVSIAHGRRDILVAQQRLHCSDVHTGHNQVRREGVSQVVEPDVSDARLLHGCRVVIRVAFRVCYTGEDVGGSDVSR